MLCRRLAKLSVETGTPHEKPVRSWGRAERLKGEGPCPLRASGSSVVALDRPLHRRYERRRVEDNFGEGLRILDCQQDDLGLLIVRWAASWAAATLKSLTLHPWFSAARLTTASASSARCASIQAERLDS